MRENDLFGKQLEPERYKEVIRFAGLQRDLTLLVAGDQSEIAERGANLSRGQRQRVSLARSVYYGADIVLLDDPLSAVDQSVSRHIFEECFMKHLKDKTVICVINQLQYLEELDYIVFIQDGTIYSQGTYSELMANCQRFNNLVSTHAVESDSVEQGEDLGAIPMNYSTFNPMNSFPAINIEVNNADVMEMNQMSVLSRNQLSLQAPKNVYLKFNIQQELKELDGIKMSTRLFYKMNIQSCLLKTFLLYLFMMIVKR